MTISEVRAELPTVIDRVELGEVVTITRHKKPVAAVVPVSMAPTEPTSDTLEEAKNLLREMEESRNRPITFARTKPGWADRLVAEIRADRDAKW